MIRNLKNVVKFLAFLGIGILILYLVYRDQNNKYLADCALRGIPEAECSLLEKLWNDFRSVKVFWLVLVLIAFMASNISRGMRWQMLIRQLGFRAGLGNAFWTVMLGYFANLGIPRIGEVIRAGVFARYEKIPVEKVVGTVVVDRAVDMVSVLVFILLAFLLQFRVIYGFAAENIETSPLLGRGILILAGGGLLGLLALYFMRARLKRTKLYGRFAKIIQGFAEGLRTIKKLDRPWVFVAHSVFIWVMYYMMNYLCFFAFEPTAHLGPLAALIVFVFGALGIIFPSPGGMGTYHFMIMAGLVIYGVSGDDALSFANILYFSIQLFCNIFFGILSLIFLPLINRSAQ